MAHRILAALAFIAAVGTAQAVDFRSVNVPAAILYDAPSQKGKKLYLVKAQTPVEVVVRLDGWFKVRDAEGSLAWIESGNVGERRMLVVTAPRAEIRQATNPDAAIVAELDKWVAVEFLETTAPGWVKVRHRDGTSGYLRSTQVWGL